MIIKISQKKLFFAILFLLSLNVSGQSGNIEARIKCERGNFAIEAGYYEDAVKVFEECIKQYDSLPEAIYGAASAYYYISDYAKAMKFVNSLLNSTKSEVKNGSLHNSAIRLAAMIEDARNSGIEMVYVKGGSYIRGCLEGMDIDCEEEERPAHRVDVEDFYIGKYEVTQAQWKSVMGKNPSYFTGCDSCPVENVSWDDIQVFIDKLNHKYPSMQFRLPGEIEWEYAARGGKKSKSFKYCGSNNPDEVAWFDKNAGNKTHPVGSKKPNELGLYDMGGNVWEWCDDWFFFYAGINTEASRGFLAKSHKADRGGCWQYTSRYVRAGARGGLNPEEVSSDLGFRLAREAKIK